MLLGFIKPPAPFPKSRRLRQAAASRRGVRREEAPDHVGGASPNVHSIGYPGWRATQATPKLCRPAVTHRGTFPPGGGSVLGPPWLENRRLDDGGRPEMSALLRQPGGFEGFGLRLKAERPAHDLPLAHLVDIELVRVDQHAAALALSVPMDGADHNVTPVQVLVDIGAELIEGRRPECPRLVDGGSAFDDAG